MYNLFIEKSTNVFTSDWYATVDGWRWTVDGPVSDPPWTINDAVNGCIRGHQLNGALRMENYTGCWHVTVYVLFVILHSQFLVLHYFLIGCGNRVIYYFYLQHDGGVLSLGNRCIKDVWGNYIDNWRGCGWLLSLRWRWRWRWSLSLSLIVDVDNQRYVLV